MKKIISIIITILLVFSLAGNAYLLVDKKNAANELDAFENTKSQQLASLNAKIDQAEADLLAETEKYNQALEAIQQMDEQALSLHQEIELISVKLSEAENNAANVEALLSIVCWGLFLSPGISFRRFEMNKQGPQAITPGLRHCTFPSTHPELLTLPRTRLCTFARAVPSAQGLSALAAYNPCSPVSIYWQNTQSVACF